MLTVFGKADAAGTRRGDNDRDYCVGVTHAAVPVLTVADHADIDAVESADAGDDTSSRLVHAAAQVFAEKGYDGAGVEEIARRAGFTTGAIYSRFSGKAELLAEAIRVHTSDEFDQLFAEHRFEGRAPTSSTTVGSHLVTGEADRQASPSSSRPSWPPAATPRWPTLLREHLAVSGDRLAAMVADSKATGPVDPSLDTDAVAHFAHAVGLGFLLFEAAARPPRATSAGRTSSHRVVDSVAGPPAPDRPPPDPTPPGAPHEHRLPQ